MTSTNPMMTRLKRRVVGSVRILTVFGGQILHLIDSPCPIASCYRIMPSSFELCPLASHYIDLFFFANHEQ